MNSRKNQVIVSGILWALGLAGMFYAASRTLHFVETTIPNENKINGYIYLLFTGIGAFGWAQVYLKHAVGATRRAVSFLLAIGDLLAEIILVYADTQYVAGANGLVTMTSEEMQIFITATVGIVAINLIGWFLYHLNDPDHRKEGLARDLADEVEEQTYKKLNTPAEKNALVNRLMPVTSSAVLADVQKMIYEAAGLTPTDGTPFDRKQLTTWEYPYPPGKEPESTAITKADWELARRINPRAAPYRFCKTCDELVPLTLRICPKCHSEMMGLPTLEDEPMPAPSPFPEPNS